MNVDNKKIIYSMIRVSKFNKNKPVLKDITLSYFYGAKIGVLGLNGSGKSSLLRILAGVDTEFNGERLSPGKTIGLLEQEPELDEEKTVRDIVEEGVQETVDLLAEFNEINAKFAEPMSDDEMNDLIERQGRSRTNWMRWMPGTWIPSWRWHGCPALSSRRYPGQCSFRRGKTPGGPVQAAVAETGYPAAG